MTTETLPGPYAWHVKAVTPRGIVELTFPGSTGTQGLWKTLEPLVALIPLAEWTCEPVDKKGQRWKTT